MRRLCWLVALIAGGLAVSAAAEEGTAQLAWGLGGILVGVAALLIAVGALILFIRLAKLLEQLEERFKK